MPESSVKNDYELDKNSNMKDIDIEKQGPKLTTTSSDTNDQPSLEPIRSHVTAQDMQPVQDTYVERGDEIYGRFSPHKKVIMTGVLSFCGFLAPISSTAVLAAIPEVASTYGTSGTIINLSNALYLVFMGLSPVFWGPLGQLYGRRIVRHLQYLRTVEQRTDMLCFHRLRSVPQECSLPSRLALPWLRIWFHISSSAF